MDDASPVLANVPGCGAHDVGTIQPCSPVPPSPVGLALSLSIHLHTVISSAQLPRRTARFCNGNANLVPPHPYFNWRPAGRGKEKEEGKEAQYAYALLKDQGIPGRAYKIRR
jgi:hypothetical protein